MIHDDLFKAIRMVLFNDDLFKAIQMVVIDDDLFKAFRTVTQYTRKFKTQSISSRLGSPVMFGDS